MEKELPIDVLPVSSSGALAQYMAPEMLMNPEPGTRHPLRFFVVAVRHEHDALPITRVGRGEVHRGPAAHDDLGAVLSTRVAGGGPPPQAR